MVSNYDTTRHTYQAVEERPKYRSRTAELKSVIVDRQKPTKTRPSKSRSIGPFRSTKKPFREVTREQGSHDPDTNLDKNMSDQIYNRVVVHKISISAIPTLTEDARLAKLKQLRRCHRCNWPRSKSHLDRLDSSQQIQLKYMRDNLLSNFEENLNEIQERAFKHGLWTVFLEALLRRRDLESFVLCCATLDDIRLLSFEQLVQEIDRDQVINCVIDTLAKCAACKQDDTCRKCECALESLDALRDELLIVTEIEALEGAEIDFNLANLLNSLLCSSNPDLKQLIRCLNLKPQLLENSKVPPTFYRSALLKLTNKNA